MGNDFLKQEAERVDYQEQLDDQERATDPAVADEGTEEDAADGDAPGNNKGKGKPDKDADADAGEDGELEEDEESPEESDEDGKTTKPGLLARIFAPVPPEKVSERLYGGVSDVSAPVAAPPPDNAGNDDILNMSKEDEDYLFGTTDKDSKGDDFLGPPGKKEMQDLAGIPGENSITGFSKKDQEALLSTEMRDESGEDFLGAPSQKAVDDVVDIPKGDDDFLFGTGMDDDRTRKSKKTKYQVGKKGKKTKVKSQEQEDHDTDEFLFGTKGAF